MTRYMRLAAIGIIRFIFLILMTGFMFELSAQTDTVQVAMPDSSEVSIPEDSTSSRLDSLTSLLPSMVRPEDTIQVSREKWLKRVKQKVKKQLPEVYTENEAVKLKIKIPWRDDLVLPYLKGLTKQSRPPPYDPTVAWQRSAVIPGWGQGYNRSYWKIPIFYAGYGAAIWWFNFNQQQYIRFGNAYFWTIDDNPDTNDEELLLRFDATRLRQRRDAFRQSRDQAVLIFLGWHVIQIAEAYVNAHLKGFDVSEDLSVKTGLDIIEVPTAFGGMNAGPGFSIKLTF